MASRLVDLLWESVDEEQKLLSSRQSEIVYSNNRNRIVKINSWKALNFYSSVLHLLVILPSKDFKQIKKNGDIFLFLSNIDDDNIWLPEYILYKTDKPSPLYAGYVLFRIRDGSSWRVDTQLGFRIFFRSFTGVPEFISKLLLETNPYLIMFISQPSINLQLIAVQQNGMVIQYIDHPSPLVQFAAIKQNPDAIMFIKPEDLAPSLKNDKPITESTNSSVTEAELISSGQAEIVWEKDNRKLIRIESYEAAAYYDPYPHGWYFSKSQSNFNDCCGKGIYMFLDSNQQRNCFAFYAESQDLLPRLYRRLDDRITLSTLFIQNRDLPDKALEIFLRDYPWLLYQVENPSIPLQLFVVGHDGTAIDQIKNPSPLVQTAALRQNPKAINNIDPDILDPKLKEKYKDYLI